MVNEISVEKASTVYGITARRYQQLAKDGFVPAPVHGQIDFIASTKAIIEYYRKKAEGSGSISLTDERTRLTRLQADLADRELKEKDGELLPYETVKTDWLRVLGAMKSRLLSIPTKYAPMLYGRTAPEIKEQIESGIHEALNELAELDYEHKKTVGRNARHIKTTGKTDHKRMGRRRKNVKSRSKR